MARMLDCHMEKVGLFPGLCPYARHFIILASAVDRDVNGGPVGRNWLCQGFQMLHLSFTFFIYISLISFRIDHNYVFGTGRREKPKMTQTKTPRKLKNQLRIRRWKSRVNWYGRSEMPCRKTFLLMLWKACSNLMIRNYPLARAR